VSQVKTALKLMGKRHAHETMSITCRINELFVIYNASSNRAGNPRILQIVAGLLSVAM